MHRFLSILVVLALSLPPVRAQVDENAAAQALDKLGARVVRDDKVPGSPIISVSLRGVRLLEDDLKPLADLRHLQRLDLAGSGLPDAALKHLKNLKALSFLNLSETAVSAEGLRQLEGSPALRELQLMPRQLNDARLKALREIGKLHALSRATTIKGQRPAAAADVHALDLEGSEVTGAGLPELADLTNLRELNIKGSLVTDAGLRELKYLKKLHTLHLGKNQLNETGWRTLLEAGLAHTLTIAKGKDGERPGSMAEVVTLDLSAAPVTPGGLRELKDFTGLRELRLDPALITDAALKALREVKLLHALSLAIGPEGRRPTGALDVVAVNLSGTRVTASGIAHLADLFNTEELELGGISLKGADMKTLAPFTKLHTLHLPADQITDAALADLAQQNQLHALTLAQAKDGGRPSGPLSVHAFYLHHTNAGEESVKEITRFKNLQYLDLNWRQITSKTIKQLADAGLVHALAGARGKDGRRPASAEDVVSLDLRHATVSSEVFPHLQALPNLEELDLTNTYASQGLAQMTGFRKLRRVHAGSNSRDWHLYVGEKSALPALTELTVSPEQLNDHHLALFAKHNFLHVLSTATTKDGGRPKSPEDVHALNLRKARFSGQGSWSLADLKNLRVLDLSETSMYGQQGRRVLKDLPQLESLNLHQTLIVRDHPEVKFLLNHPNLKQLVLKGCTLRDSHLADLKELKDLEKLDLSYNNEITDKGMVHLKELTKLRELDLSVTSVGPPGLSELRGLKNLESLGLYHRSIYMDDIKGFKDLPLKKLVVSEIKANVRDMNTIGGLKNLRWLDLSRNKLQSAWLAALTSLPLEHLNLTSTELRDEAAGHLAKITSLKHLDLENTFVKDAALKDLRKLDKLEFLSLMNTWVTGSGLKELAEMKSLRALEVSPKLLGDDTLQLLREVGLLHKLSVATTRDGQPAAGPEQVFKLRLSGATLTDAGLKELKGFKNLEVLGLGGSRVTGAGLLELKDMKQLREVNLYGLRIERGAREALWRHLPGVRFVEQWDPVR